MKRLSDEGVIGYPRLPDDPWLSSRARALIGEGDNELFLSAASGWEVAIKAKLGRLQLPGNPARFLSQQLSLNGIETLPIQMSHALHVYTLPEHHRDPFDRLLVAQAQLKNLPILTSDSAIAKYQVKTIW